MIVALADLRPGDRIVHRRHGEATVISSDTKARTAQVRLDNQHQISLTADRDDHHWRSVRNWRSPRSRL
jgi:hypothetical protein